MNTILFYTLAIIVGCLMGGVFFELYEIIQYHNWMKFKEEHKNLFN